MTANEAYRQFNVLIKLLYYYQFKNEIDSIGFENIIKKFQAKHKDKYDFETFEDVQKRIGEMYRIIGW